MIEEKQICQNCGTELNGKYCSQCGQRNKNFQVSIRELSHEFIEEALSFDKRLFRSLQPFLLKPGFLTLEYLSGKRKQYISPLKLYFFFSFLFFFLNTFKDSKTTVITSADIQTYDSLKTSKENNTRFTLVDRKKAWLKFSTVDSSKIEKIGNVFGFNLSTGLKGLQNNPRLFFDKMREHRPKIIFFLLPVFALLLKMLYFRSKKLYITHLVFSFHFHAFIFLILLFVDLLEFTGFEFIGAYSFVFLAAIPLNLYLGMKRVYRQTHWKTVLKLCLLGGSYSIVFLLTFFIAMLMFVRIFYT